MGTVQCNQDDVMADRRSLFTLGRNLIYEIEKFEALGNTEQYSYAPSLKYDSMFRFRRLGVLGAIDYCLKDAASYSGRVIRQLIG
jgi:hypothetical protein